MIIQIHKTQNIPFQLQKSLYDLRNTRKYRQKESKLKQQSIAKHPKNTKPTVTVLVLSRNVERYINRCLKSIFSMNYKNIEVILIDSHSSDNTCSIAEKFPVKIIKLDKPSIPKAYNAGVHTANGNYIFIINGDSMVSKTFLKKAVNILDTNTRIAIVSGTRKQLITDNIVTSLYQFRFLRHDKLGDISSIGGNYLFDKKNYKHYIRTLDENLVANEEKLISKCFKKAGLKIIRIREIVMIHMEDNISINAYWKKHLWYAKGKASMFVNNHEIDKDFLISLTIFISLISIFSIGKYILLGILILISGYLYLNAIKHFSQIDSLKITAIEVISTLLRALSLPLLIISEYAKIDKR